MAQALRLDQRIVSHIALELGGRRIGRRWRFRWGTVMEFFNNANFEKRSRNAWLARVIINGQILDTQVFPSRSEKRAGMDGRAEMGSGKEKVASDHQKKEGRCFSAYETFLAWGEQYLAFAKQNDVPFHVHREANGNAGLFRILPRFGYLLIAKTYKTGFYQFLAQIADERGSRRANVYRKNLLSAWNWG